MIDTYNLAKKNLWLIAESQILKKLLAFNTIKVEVWELATLSFLVSLTLGAPITRRVLLAASSPTLRRTA